MPGIIGCLVGLGPWEQCMGKIVTGVGVLQTTPHSPWETPKLPIRLAEFVCKVNHLADLFGSEIDCGGKHPLDGK